MGGIRHGRDAAGPLGCVIDTRLLGVHVGAVYDCDACHVILPRPGFRSLAQGYQRKATTALQIVRAAKSGKEMHMRKRLALTIGTLALAGPAIAVPDHPAWSQAGRTIRVVISVPPGGSIDLLARILADHISSMKGQSIVVESRPGAGGIIAAEAVARAAPDGNTLLINNNGMIISAILRKVNYDPQAGFQPICYLVTTPQIIVVNGA